MAPKKPVAKPKAKKRGKVDNDPLADLGLDIATETETPKEVVKPAKAAAKTTKSETTKTTQETVSGSDTDHEQVEVGEIEFGFSEFIPTAKRKAEGSKYKFDQLVAPSVWDDGPNKGKPKIANFVVRLQEGVDPDKLRRSVQSATTQANRQGSAAGKYFVSRTATKDGKFIGMIVYRTDQRPKK